MRLKNVNTKAISKAKMLDGRISFIVCSNGYGHLKRVLVTANALLNQNNFINIDIYCKEELITFAINESNFTYQDRINFNANATSQEISWLARDGITRKEYKAWEEELTYNKYLKESSLIISDNHVLPLRCFDNVLLMGSFLWHDLAKEKDQETIDIIESEILLLKKKKPSMICLEAMVMPGVLKQSNPISVPWMTQPYSGHYQHNTEKKHVLITGGGTTLINDKLAKVAFELTLLNPDLVVYLDAKLFQITNSENNKQLCQFNFTQEDFASLDVIVCRPGIGILTDSAQYGIPVFMIGDGKNKEITHNYARIKEMGIGIGIDQMEQDAHLVACAIKSFLDNSEALYICRKQWSRQSKGGAEVAALEILSYMSKTETR